MMAGDTRQLSGYCFTSPFAREDPDSLATHRPYLRRNEHLCGQFETDRRDRSIRSGLAGVGTAHRRIHAHEELGCVTRLDDEVHHRQVEAERCRHAAADVGAQLETQRIVRRIRGSRS